MTAKYLIRMDDACHTMNRRKWQMVEDLLDSFAIKPIVAIVPDNKDRELIVDSVDSAFWDKVRSWQKKGWAIAMHGCTHVMRETDSELIIPFHKRSEFAGLPLEAQAAAIKRSWDLFAAQRVEPTVWVAPAHSFDWVTLEALKQETPIRIVSDGIAANSYFEGGLHWVPQQLWDFRERSCGLWTVCLHPNTIEEETIPQLRSLIQHRYCGRISCIQDLTLNDNSKGIIDRAYEFYFWQFARFQRLILKMKGYRNG